MAEKSGRIRMRYRFFFAEDETERGEESGSQILLLF